jgi:GTPase involved in cell partitioning and DNA repair
MEKFGPELAARPTLLAFTKMDLTGARENAECALASIGHPAGEVHYISAATGEGIALLLDGMLALGKRQPNVA